MAISSRIKAIYKNMNNDTLKKESILAWLAKRSLEQLIVDAEWEAMKHGNVGNNTLKLIEEEILIRFKNR